MDTPPPPPPQSPIPDYATPAPASLDIGRCFNDAMDVFKKNALILILAAVIFQLLSVFTLFILCGPLCGGIYLMTLSALSSPDKKIDIGLMFATFNRFGPLVGLFFLTLIPSVIGLFFFIVPGILLMALWMFSFPLLIERNMPVTEAMTASWRIVMRRGLGWNLLLTAIIFVLALVPSLIPFGGWIVGWLLAPITWLIGTSAYIQQVRERESDLADILSPRGFPVQPTAAPAST
ncbi:MAG TPA: hypothetical protein VGQ99_16640 [Tepidisphaeraceae bacterium]|jgi:uncharacterized membrane protein|nr:hypothetical protein [Tepidisphaeraceae bacterium]